jgi:hypothetical protein
MRSSALAGHLIEPLGCLLLPFAFRLTAKSRAFLADVCIVNCLGGMVLQSVNSRVLIPRYRQDTKVNIDRQGPEVGGCRKQVGQRSPDEGSAVFKLGRAGSLKMRCVKGSTGYLSLG